MSNYRNDYRAAVPRATPSSVSSNHHDNYVTIPREVYEQLMNPSNQVQSRQSKQTYSYDDMYNYGQYPFDSYGAHGYSVEHFQPPLQTPRPENAGPVSRTLYHRNATAFFRHEIQNIDRKYLDGLAQSGKMVIVDCTVLFGRFYMKGDQVLGNKAEELIRDMSLLWLHRTGFIIVEVSSGWRNDHLDKGIKYLLGYKTKKGGDPVRMTKEEMDAYLFDHPVWNEEKKFKLFQY